MSGFLHDRTGFSSPKLYADVVHVEDEGDHLFINPALPDWLMTNGNGAMVLSLCNGLSGYADIVRAATENGISDEAGVRKLVEAAEAHGIIDPAGSGLEPFRVTSRSPRRLETLLIKMTNRCNLRCDYCYAVSGTGSSLSWETLESIASDLRANFHPLRVELSGGEPLLNKATLPFARLLKSDGHSLALLTNGTLIDERNAAEIASLFDTVQISIDGDDAEGHDCRRGAGSHGKATRAAELILRQGGNLQIGMTLTYGSLPGLQGLIEKYGERLKVKSMTPIGRGGAGIDALRTEEFYEHSEPYYVSDRAGNPRRKVAEFVSRSRRKALSNCGLGDMHVSVDEVGHVYPCHLVHDPRYLCGDVTKSALSDIYHKSDVLVSLDSFGVQKMEPCRTCVVRHLCVGGCPAVSLAESDRLDVAPSFCDFERDRFIDAIFDVERGY